MGFPIEHGAYSSHLSYHLGISMWLTLPRFGRGGWLTLDLGFPGDG